MQAAMIVGAMFLIMGGIIIGNAYLEGYEDAEDKHIEAAAENLRESNLVLAELRDDEQELRMKAETRAQAIEDRGAEEIQAANQRADEGIAQAMSQADKAIAAAMKGGEREDQTCPALCLLPSSD